jgi:hypothetical protein
MASGRLGIGSSAMSASIFDWGASLALPWMRDRLLYSSNMQLSGMIDTGLIYYLLSVAWFPAFCLLVFGRAGAQRYFVSRPSAPR